MKPDPAEEIAARVAAELRRVREEKGLSMNEVAWRAGISPRSVSFIERGLTNATLRNLLRIAGALEVDLWEILRDVSRSVCGTRGSSEAGLQ